MASNGMHMGDVVNSIRRHKVIIIVVTIVAAILGAVFYMAGPKRYEGKTEFILRNPTYGDRNYIYDYETKFIDYFGNEDDIDRLIVMSDNGIVQDRVIRNLNLAQAYGIDQSNPKQADRLTKIFSKNYNIMRTENKDLVLSYVDEDPVRAAKVANECVAVLDSTYTGYYKEMRQSIYQAVLDKEHEEDSIVDVLTDTLVALRTKYGIADIISPSRNNILLSGMKERNGKDFSRGEELVQNVESLKDQAVSDRARQTTLVNQYQTAIQKDQMPSIKVLTYAKPPVSPKGIGGMYTVLAAAFLGFFFSTMLVSFSDKYIRNA